MIEFVYLYKIKIENLIKYNRKICENFNCLTFLVHEIQPGYRRTAEP